MMFLTAIYDRILSFEMLARAVSIPSVLAAAYMPPEPKASFSATVLL
jgi:hypothetical protein